MSDFMDDFTKWVDGGTGQFAWTTAMDYVEGKQKHEREKKERELYGLTEEESNLLRENEIKETTQETEDESAELKALLQEARMEQLQENTELRDELFMKYPNMFRMLDELDSTTIETVEQFLAKEYSLDIL